MTPGAASGSWCMKLGDCPCGFPKHPSLLVPPDAPSLRAALEAIRILANPASVDKVALVLALGAIDTTARAALAAAPEQPPALVPYLSGVDHIYAGLDDNFDPNPKIDPYALDVERLARALHAWKSVEHDHAVRDIGSDPSCQEDAENVARSYAATLVGGEAE